MAQQQLTLPYFEIKKVAGRGYLRKKFKRNSKESYQIPLNKIKERQGFNQRKVYEDIEELATSLLIHGQLEPMVLDVLPDGSAYVDQGHRRLRAHLLNVANKKYGKDVLIEFYPNKSDVTELDRMLNQFTSNNHKKKLKPFEVAEVAYRIKNNFSEKPKSHEEVAELMGVSRQQIDNYILISSADDRLKNEMVIADMKITECLSLIRNKKKSDSEGFKKEAESHKSSSTAAPLPKDALADEISELKNLQAPEGDDDYEEEEEVRTTNPEGKDFKSKPLDLVGNKIANNSKSEKDDTVKYDESREEIKQVQNIIKLADKMEAIVTKLDIPEGSKKDVSDIVKWMQKDLSELRTWVHKNKKR